MTRLVRIQLTIFAVVTVLALAIMSIVYLQLPRTLGWQRTDVTLQMPDTGGLYKNANVSYLGNVIGRVDARGVIVTSRADEDDVDFVSRFFAPAVGIDEDPVTGSAHCCLAPYWSEKLGRAALVGRQVSPRGGTVRVRVDGDRVQLGGRAVTVFRGELLAAPA